MNKKYYSERKKNLVRASLSLEQLKKLFLELFKELQEKLYFEQAIGKNSSDGELGIWGDNIPYFILKKIKMSKVWPIEKEIDNYTETKLFSVMELLYNYVSKPKFIWEDDNGITHGERFDKKQGQKEYRSGLNDCLVHYGVGYKLSDKGDIIEKPPSGFEKLIGEVKETEDKDNIDERIQHAISCFHKYDSKLKDKKDAIRTLCDVLEFLRKSDIKLEKKDDSALFQIMNKFDIRHHNKFQQGNYTKEIWYNWLFYTFLASINVLLKLKKETPK